MRKKTIRRIHYFPTRRRESTEKERRAGAHILFPRPGTGKGTTLVSRAYAPHMESGFTGCGKTRLLRLRIALATVFLQPTPCFSLLWKNFWAPPETLLPALTPQESVSPYGRDWRRSLGTGRTSPPSARRALSPAAECCPVCPSRTPSPLACVSSG